MAEHSKIEWTDSTWNPVTGCTRVSPGCAHCYIERTPPFRMAGRSFKRVKNEETTGVVLHENRLDQPLRWKKPRRVFVCSLADLFHDDVPDSYIAEVFGRMALAHQHIFQVLTKRPARMRALLADPFFWAKVEGTAQRLIFETTGEDTGESLAVHGPLPNVWLGVSIENSRYTWRADVLREIPAAVRFISAEPLLGSLFVDDGRPDDWSASKNAGGDWSIRDASRRKRPLDLTGIDWIIVGGESGPGARPMRLEWVREIIRHCDAYAPVCCGQRDLEECCGEPVPAGSIEQLPAVFVKQLGTKPIIRREELAALVAVPIECEHGFDVCSECDAGETELPMTNRKGGDWDEWPDDLRIREFPTLVAA